MSYGLYDCDFVLDKTKYFNLELMKYSTYLKRKRNIVSLSTSFNPEQYTNFIYRKDFEYEVDDALPIYKNLTYGGRAFHKATYVPLPIEIESCTPDTSIYAKGNAISTSTHCQPPLFHRLGQTPPLISHTFLSGSG